MAQRRMLSRVIIESGEFEELPAMAQLLYMRMNLIADDDGFADCFALSRLLGVSLDSFTELVDAGFIRKVEGKKYLYHICHWRTHNTLEKGKYRASEYYGALSNLYSEDDYFSVLPTWERPGNEPLPQSKSSQGSPVEGSPGKNKSVEVKSVPVQSNDADHDQYVKDHFPTKMKEYLIDNVGFKQISIDELTKLLYVDGFSPEVISWIASKAVDNSTYSPAKYFWEAISDKEQYCKTTEQLYNYEGDDDFAHKEILRIVSDINIIRSTIEDEYRALPF